MAERSEALAQMARLLGDARLREAEPKIVQAAVERGFDRLISGLVAEAAASDDVIDRASALIYLEDRLSFLGELLTREQRIRLGGSLRAEVAKW